MKDLLKEMNKMSREIKRERKQSTLKDFVESKKQPAASAKTNEIRIIVDNRELRSAITKALKELEVSLAVETLEVADYILSDRVAIEAKTADDFAQSIIDKRLFQQLGALKENFTIPLLLITGPSLYGSSGINPAAIRGAISAALTSFNVPVINVKTSEEAAALMFAIARQEQSSQKMTLSIRGKKPVLSMSALQEYIVAGLPGVNTTLAKRLLIQFRSITELANTSIEQLAEVHGIGKTKAQKIREALDAQYEADD
jgi:Fanconi anemia group M protein